MGITRKSTLVALAAAAVAVTGGGAAIAAGGSGSPAAESTAIVDATAKNLGVTSTQLSNALKQALLARVDAQVTAGTLTQEQPTAIKAKINAGEFPLFGRGHGGPGHRQGPRGDMTAAASYLGLTQAELRTALQSGKTLAEVATANGKTVAGLTGALTDAAKKHIAADVKAGKLTEAQQEKILESLSQHIADMVNGVRPEHGPGGPGGPGGGMGAPPQGA